MGIESIALVVGAVILGALSAILPLGPVTVLVVRRALAADYVGALQVGMGRVVPESLYCTLAAFGVTALIDRFPGVRFGIELLGTLLFLAVGVWLWFQDARPPAVDPEQDSEVLARKQRWGAWSGFIISLLNPTLILTWSAGIAIAMSMLHLQLSLADKIAFPIALGVGIGLGYAILVVGLRKWGDRIGDHLLRWILRVMAVVFVVTAIANGVRLFQAI